MNKISIIIPIFNTSNLLERCLDSILNQSYNDWYLILIDDGSNDGSELICDKYSNSDSRIKAFHKINEGASSARNLGLEKIETNLITFIDSDDTVEPFFLEHLISHSQRYDAVLNKYGIKESRFPENPPLWSYGAGVAGKLFRKDIIENHNLKFNTEIKVIGEDTIFLFQYLCYCKNVYFSQDRDYIYWKNSESLTHRARPYNLILPFYEELDKLRRDPRLLKIFKSEDLEKTLFGAMSDIIYSLYNNDLSYSKRIEILKKLDFNLYYKHLNGKGLKFHLLKTLIGIKNIYLFDVFQGLAYKTRNFLYNDFKEYTFCLV